MDIKNKVTRQVQIVKPDATDEAAQQKYKTDIKDKATHQVQIV
jgi:t-SNARE complex subunit (syntaxin)